MPGIALPGISHSITEERALVGPLSYYSIKGSPDQIKCGSAGHYRTGGRLGAGRREDKSRDTKMTARTCITRIPKREEGGVRMSSLDYDYLNIFVVFHRLEEYRKNRDSKCSRSYERRYKCL